MTRSLESHIGPKRILEVGPGTGVFSRHVLSSLRPGDQFDLVEVNETFCATLENNLLTPFRAASPGIPVTVHQGSIEDVLLDEPYDFIICGLPFNSFSLSMVRSIFRRLLAALDDGGELAYFEYVGMKAMKAPVAWGRRRSRLNQRIALSRYLEDRYDGNRTVVLRNFMPARAIHLCKR